jgi:outer membrane protein TolC
LARDNLSDYQETVRLNEIRLKAGEISPTELDRIRVEQARFETDLGRKVHETGYAAWLYFH